MPIRSNPGPQFSRRCAVTTTTRVASSCSRSASSGASYGALSRAAHWSASIAVLPVTNTRSAGDPLADEVLLVEKRRGQVERRDPGDQLAVQLLGEGRERVLGAQPGLYVRDRDLQVEGRERCGDRTGGVAVHDAGGRIGVVVALAHLPVRGAEGLGAELLEAEQHGREQLVEGQLGLPDAEVHMGGQPVERQHRLDDPRMLSGRNDERLAAFAVGHGAHQREQLDRFRPGADDDQHLPPGVGCVVLRRVEDDTGHAMSLLGRPRGPVRSGWSRCDQPTAAGSRLHPPDQVKRGHIRPGLARLPRQIRQGLRATKGGRIAMTTEQAKEQAAEPGQAPDREAVAWSLSARSFEFSAPLAAMPPIGALVTLTTGAARSSWARSSRPARSSGRRRPPEAPGCPAAGRWSPSARDRT